MSMRLRPLSVVFLAFAALLVAAVPARSMPRLTFDLASGKVVEAEDAFTPWYPASLTKLMTAYVVFKAIESGRYSLASPVTISSHALAEPPSKMGFKAGTVLTLDNALKMMLVRSANDIAMALAETVGGSEEGFVAEMNETAKRLGMTATRFVNPNGLPEPGQQTTARDLAILVRHLLTEFPQYRHYYGVAAIQFGKRVLRSPNTLLERYRGANGLKTGFICASGFNIAASATRGGRTVVAIVLGARSALERAAEAKILLDRGFDSEPWLPGGVTIDQLVPSGPQPSTPADMRDLVCGKNRKPVDVEALAQRAGSSGYASAFGAARAAAAVTAASAAAAAVQEGEMESPEGDDIKDPVTYVIGPRLYPQQPVKVSIIGTAAARSSVLPRPRPARP